MFLDNFIIKKVRGGYTLKNGYNVLAIHDLGGETPLSIHDMQKRFEEDYCFFPSPEDTKNLIEEGFIEQVGKYLVYYVDGYPTIFTQEELEEFL